MTRKQKRLASIATILVVIGGAAALVLTALSDSVAYFHSPSDIVAKAPAQSQRIRLGGLVEAGSVVRDGSQHV
ncbi:MAG: cytochrome c maturation protein CcmE, partial [Aurantimonas coralicida]|nr:cytochrome c maturation protein CcmE [Aurantimonas coralicida]